MTNKEITSLLYKILSLITEEGAGFNVHFCEVLQQGELIDAIKSVSGEEPTMEAYLSENGTRSKAEVKEIISSIFEEVSNGGSVVEKVVLKDYLKNAQNYPNELLTDPNLDWLMEKFKQTKAGKSKAQKPKEVNKATEQPKINSDLVKEFIKNIYKYTQNQACGNAVKLQTYFPDESMKKLCQEVFGKTLDIFDVYSEKEIKEDLLWGYEDAPDEDSLKDYLTDEMGVSECLLEGKVLSKLVEMI